MKKYAEIHYSIVQGIHEVPDDITPIFNPNSMRYLVEVTEEAVLPEYRWKHDMATKKFRKPDPQSMNPITSKNFYLRLTGPEREAFIVSADSKVKQFAYWLTLSGDVDLTETKIITATNYLESSGIIGVGRAAEILIIEQS